MFQELLTFVYFNQVIQKIKIGLHFWSTVRRYRDARYGDDAGSTVEENSSIFSVIRMR